MADKSSGSLVSSHSLARNTLTLFFVLQEKLRDGRTIATAGGYCRQPSIYTDLSLFLSSPPPLCLFVLSCYDAPGGYCAHLNQEKYLMTITPLKDEERNVTYYIISSTQTKVYEKSFILLIEMDPIIQTLEEVEANSSPFATISISRSLSSKIPCQVLNHVPVATSVSVPPKPYSYSYSYRSSSSSNPLQNPLSVGPRRPLDPSNAAGIRRASIVWFRNDLRVLDNECLSSANDESTSILNVYCFDPRDYGKSSSGFDKTGPYRASFLIQSVADLRNNLQARGSDLVVRIGNPESVLADLAREVGAQAVYAHREVSHDEVKAEDKIEAAMKEEGVEMKYTWGSTLYHVDDLPFNLEDMPTNYGGFKEKVKGLEVRKTIAALDQLKPKPARGDVDPGEIPTLMDLGLKQEGTSGISPSMVGGESEAIHKIQTFAAECKAQPTKENVYGANLSCKISPWLAMGCISPRTMFEELKKTASTSITAAFNKNNDSDGSSGAGTNWLMYELMWRDFFRFITKKYSSANKVDLAPVTA